MRGMLGGRIRSSKRELVYQRPITRRTFSVQPYEKSPTLHNCVHRSDSLGNPYVSGFRKVI